MQGSSPGMFIVGEHNDGSCQRCHRRKKRCDRTLPQCDTCRHAHVSCSFLDDDRQVGTYSVAYVQGLEGRIRDLEEQLALATVASPSSLGKPEMQLPSVLPDPVILNFPSYPDVNEALGALPRPLGSIHEQGGSLVDELKILSLEATAERHLGSSSGLSFARLTQAVLRRLCPDKAEFIFDSGPGIHPPDESNLAWSPESIITSPSGMVHFDANFLYSSCDFDQLPPSRFVEDEAVLADLNFPAHSQISYLVDFYFAHSHTLYPIIRRNEFMSVLWRIYHDPMDPLAQSPLWLFRIWMVLAIGSTTHCSVSLTEESESVLYYNKAMGYFEAALEYGDMAALEVLMLQVSYSFFNQIGPNTWFLVGVAARMAIGMGLHSATTYDGLPVDVAEYRKRILFSLYMMDRVVSMALGRPFAIHDDDIDVSPFTGVDDENINSEGIIPQDSLQPSSMAVPLHILSLRKIASEIANNVYSAIRTGRMNREEREETLQTIHRKLIRWRRDMPFPLADVHSQVPHLSSNWFDLNYYAHVAMLYRPSPLFPTLDQSKVKVLAMAASMSIRQAINMHRQRRFAYNWLNLLSVYTSTLSLMYSITAQPDNLASVLEETKAVHDLELAIELLDTFGKKFPAASKIRRMVQEVLNRFHGVCSASSCLMED
ncbi:fungal-specific transcription factor domain-containing protein [Aspergillus ambiguus]|uniref:Zn(II)2Cys6 transcription factor n=1 Tax=Aspergillus ambiguus TaxID=176160 RepID=UPI003CCDFA48